MQGIAAEAGKNVSIRPQERPSRRRAAEVLPGRRHPGVGPVERRHERDVHRPGRHRDPAEGQVAGGTGIGDHRAGVAEVACGAGRGVDAHLAHRAADHEIRHPLRREERGEIGARETVRPVLLDDLLPGQRANAAVDLRTRRPGEEERRPTGVRLILRGGYLSSYL